MKFCRHCGKEIPDAAAFCVHCGSKVGEAPGGPRAGTDAFAQTALLAAPPARNGTQGIGPPPTPVQADGRTHAWSRIPEPPTGRPEAAPAVTMAGVPPAAPAASPTIPSVTRQGLGSAPPAGSQAPDATRPALAAPSRVPPPARAAPPATAEAPPRATPAASAPARATPVAAAKSTAKSEDLRMANSDPGFDRGLRLTGIVLGTLLFGYFFVPVGPEYTFLWDKLREGRLSDVHFMHWIYPTGMGLLLILLGLIPLPAALRGILCAALGIAPFLYVVAQAGPLLRGFDPGKLAGHIARDAIGAADLTWRAQALAGGLFVLPFALYLRARRWSSIVARILVAVGIAGMLALYLYPLSSPALEGVSRIPAVAMFERLGGLGTMAYVASGLLAFPLLLALLSFAAFAGSGSSGGGNLLGTLFLLWAPLAIAMGIVRGAMGGAHPSGLLELGRLLIFGFACQFFVVYGLVHLFPARRPRS